MGSVAQAEPGGSRVVLEPVAKDQVQVLQNLVELYVHDFSEHVPTPIKANGRFDFQLGEHWWIADDHHAFFIRLNDQLAGFALARRGSRLTGAKDVMDVAEFFVLRGVRRRNIGTRAALALFRAFPGAWEIRVRQTNVAAQEFWCRAAEKVSGRATEGATFIADDVEWSVLRIEVAPRDGVIEST